MPSKISQIELNGTTYDVRDAEALKLAGTQTENEIVVLSNNENQVLASGTTLDEIFSRIDVATVVDNVINGEWIISIINDDSTVDLSGYDSSNVVNQKIATALSDYYTKLETYDKTEVDRLIANINKITIDIEDDFPANPSENVLYFIAKQGDNGDVYDEYFYIDNNWEHVGSTEIDLSDYATHEWVLENSSKILGLISNSLFYNNTKTVALNENEDILLGNVGYFLMRIVATDYLRYIQLSDNTTVPVYIYGSQNAYLYSGDNIFCYFNGSRVDILSITRGGSPLVVTATFISQSGDGWIGTLDKSNKEILEAYNAGKNINLIAEGAQYNGLLVRVIPATAPETTYPKIELRNVRLNGDDELVEELIIIYDSNSEIYDFIYYSRKAEAPVTDVQDENGDTLVSDGIATIKGLPYIGILNANAGTEQGSYFDVEAYFYDENHNKLDKDIERGWFFFSAITSGKNKMMRAHVNGGEDLIPIYMIVPGTTPQHFNDYAINNPFDVAICTYDGERIWVQGIIRSASYISSQITTALGNYYTKQQTYTKTEVNNIIGSLTLISFLVVDSLPATGRSNIIYLAPSSSSDTGNVYDEWIYINSAWELIGSTAVDLTGYATESWVQEQDYAQALTTEQMAQATSALADYVTINGAYFGTDGTNIIAI